MPKPFPEEFRREVIAVARQGDQSIAQVAKNFGAGMRSFTMRGS